MAVPKRKSGPGAGRLMILITDGLAKKIPSLYATEDVPLMDKKVWVKLFNPYGIGTWYICEYDAEKELAWGFAEIHEGEWGYISIAELNEISFMGGMVGIERDIHFKPRKVSEIPDVAKQTVG